MSKSFLEAGLASTSFLNQGADLVANKGASSMIAAASNAYDLGAFALVGGSSIKT